MKLWREIACAAAATPLLALGLNVGSVAAQESWRITGLDPEARIHLRERAHRRAKIVAYVPGDARGLRRGRCAANWCQVEYNGIKGWVFARYLAPDKAGRQQAEPAPSDPLRALSQQRSLPLAKGAGEEILVYSFPNEKMPIAGKLPSDTASVEGLGRCVAGMCYIRSGDLIGWIRTDAIAASEITVEEEDQGEEKDATAALTPGQAAEEAKAINKTEPTAAPAAVAATLPNLGDIGNKTYALAGLAGQTGLEMRERPDNTSPILAWIPPAAKDVEGLRKCVEKWCLVRHGNVSGWVARRHLADVGVESSQTFQVKGVELWGNVDVLDYPNPNAHVVGRIPSYATGIVPIGGCDEDWCHVRYLGIAGWVSGQYLQPQAR